MSTINTANDRTFVYENSPLQFIDAGGNKSLALVKNWNFTPNMSDFDIDRIDTAAPVFTKKSDILGSFSFNPKNTVDFYDPGSALSPITYAYWSNQIALGQPPTITILSTMKAPDSSGDKFAKILFKGRIMSCPLDRVAETGVPEFTVNGEITEITSVTREAS